MRESPPKVWLFWVIVIKEWKNFLSSLVPETTAYILWSRVDKILYHSILYTLNLFYINSICSYLIILKAEKCISVNTNSLCLLGKIYKKQLLLLKVSTSFYMCYHLGLEHSGQFCSLVEGLQCLPVQPQEVPANLGWLSFMITSEKSSENNSIRKYKISVWKIVAIV